MSDFTQPQLEEWAQEMRAAQDGVRQIAPFTSRVPFLDVATAYRIADLLHRARMAEGRKPVGRKIGFTNREMWARYGVREPLWAYVYDTTVVQLAGSRASCPLGRFTEPKIEPEIVFGFRSAPRPGCSRAELVDSIGWIAHGFEIVQSHFPGWKFEAADTAIDCVLHAALFVGPRKPMSELGEEGLAALESFSLSLTCDGREVERGRGSNVLDGPLHAVEHMLAVLSAQPQYAPLGAGEIVTTGTVTLAHSVRPGEAWHSHLDGLDLPGLAIEFSG